VGPNKYMPTVVTVGDKLNVVARATATRARGVRAIADVAARLDQYDGQLTDNLSGPRAVAAPEIPAPITATP
jgi:hypothetical protein